MASTESAVPAAKTGRLALGRESDDALSHAGHSQTDLADGPSVAQSGAVTACSEPSPAEQAVVAGEQGSEQLAFPADDQVKKLGCVAHLGEGLVAPL